MKKLFIETKRKFDESNIKFDLLDKLPGETIALAATIQYIDLVPVVKKYLESKGKKILIKKGAYYDAHVLGCNSSALDKSADTLLMLTDGTFHAINNAIQLQKEIYIFTTHTLEKIDQSEIDKHNKRTLTKQKKFLFSEVIGLLVSSKHGQHQNAIHEIKKRIADSGRKVYVFESDNINVAEFDNFPQIQMWINTACFGLGRDDMRVINLSNILEFLK